MAYNRTGRCMDASTSQGTSTAIGCRPRSHLRRLRSLALSLLGRLSCWRLGVPPVLFCCSLLGRLSCWCRCCPPAPCCGAGLLRARCGWAGGHACWCCRAACSPACCWAAGPGGGQTWCRWLRLRHAPAHGGCHCWARGGCSGVAPGVGTCCGAEWTCGAAAGGWRRRRVRAPDCGSCCGWGWPCGSAFATWLACAGGSCRHRARGPDCCSCCGRRCCSCPGPAWCRWRCCWAGPGRNACGLVWAAAAAAAAARSRAASPYPTAARGAVGAGAAAAGGLGAAVGTGLGGGGSRCPPGVASPRVADAPATAIASADGLARRLGSWAPLGPSVLPKYSELSQHSGLSDRSTSVVGVGDMGELPAGAAARVASKPLPCA